MPSTGSREEPPQNGERDEAHHEHEKHGPQHDASYGAKDKPSHLSFHLSPSCVLISRQLKTMVSLPEHFHLGNLLREHLIE